MTDNVYPFDKPDFGPIRMTAYELLLQQPQPHIGMSAKNIVVPDKKLIFDTLQNYSQATGICMYDLTASGKISLGCNVNFYNKTYLLLHNDNINSTQCLNWTNLHEIGHICLGHEDNGDKEEVEANFFAACFAMPDAVIRYIESTGHTISKQFIMEYFNVSPQAASKKLKTMRSGLFSTHLDSQIIKVLKGDIDFVLKDITRPKAKFINFSY